MCVSMSHCALGIGHGSLLENGFVFRHIKSTSSEYTLFMPALLRKYLMKQ